MNHGPEETASDNVKKEMKVEDEDYVYGYLWESCRLFSLTHPFPLFFFAFFLWNKSRARKTRKTYSEVSNRSP